MIVAATGHRPDKLGGHDDTTRLVLEGHARTILAALQPDGVISGMALGWDQAVAQAALDLGFPLIAAIPFVGHADRWPRPARDRYFRLLSEAATKVKVWALPGYRTEDIRDALMARNRWMVDNAGLMAALWDGSRGGTGNCIDYARRVGRPVLNGWDSLQPYRESHEWLI